MMPGKCRVRSCRRQPAAVVEHYEARFLLCEHHLGIAVELGTPPRVVSLRPMVSPPPAVI